MSIFNQSISYMDIVGYIIYGIGVIVALGWIIGIRIYIKNGQGVTKSTVNTTMLFIISLVIVPILNLSPLHLLWMFPVSLVLGILSFAFPFSLLSIPGTIIGYIVCIGLNQQAIQKNRERVQRFQELVREEGLTAEEAKKHLMEEGY